MSSNPTLSPENNNKTDVSTADIFIDSATMQIDTLRDSALTDKSVTISILRTDLLDPAISGNKWFKLKYNLLKARSEGYRTLLSFGGAWSNHLHALAAAGQRFGFQTIGIVRGELPVPLNPCLADARQWGMQLSPVSRSEYQQKHTPAFLEKLRQQFGDFYLVPEGGANLAGIQGCMDILAGVESTKDMQHSFSHYALACGTGTTMAGLICRASLPVIGVQVLKGQGYLTNEINKQLTEYALTPASSWQVKEQYHCGGYAKLSNELLDFMSSFQSQHDIPLEPVYSGKLLMGLFDMVKTDEFPPGSHILAIHGGGLQGKRGFSIFNESSVS